MKNVLFVALFCALSGGVFAQQAQSRYALVIGNGAYRTVPKLNNTVNDAEDMAASLKKLGYQVDLHINADRLTMIDAVEAFSAKLARNSNTEGFVWFTGHGVQIKDENYLLPIDVKDESLARIEATAYPLNGLLSACRNARNRVNVIVVDACRNNPFSGGAKGGVQRGLAVVNDVPTDVFVMFATAPGTTASDGSSGSRNSPFAQAFLQNMASNEPLQLMLSDVTNTTLSLTNGAQRPYIGNSSITEKYYSLGIAQTAPASSPQKVSTNVSKAAAPTGNPFAGATWQGRITYKEDGKSYSDLYDIVLVANGTCIITVTTNQDGQSVIQDGDGLWSFDDNFFRMNVDFLHPVIQRLTTLNWISVYQFDENKTRFTLLVLPYSDATKTVRAAFVKTETR